MARSLDILVQKRRDKAAAKILRSTGICCALHYRDKNLEATGRAVFGPRLGFLQQGNGKPGGDPDARLCPRCSSNVFKRRNCAEPQAVSLAGGI
jgi:hypothetical protein